MALPRKQLESLGDTPFYHSVSRCVRLTYADTPASRRKAMNDHRGDWLALGRATLSRRIERLEYELNTPLFSRAQTGCRFTVEGNSLFESAEQMEYAMLSISS